MITEIFQDSFKYTFKDKKAFIKLGTISLFSFLIMPIFLLFGYSYRIVSTGLQGVMINSKDPLPKITPISPLLKEGLKIFLVISIYSILSIALTILIFSNTELINIIGTHSNFSITLNTGTFFLMLLLIIWFIPFLFIAVAIPHMIENNELKSAFKIKELIKIINFFGITKYIKFYIITIILIIISLIITFLISQGIINMINYLLTTIQNHSSSLIISYLNITVFILLELCIVIPFFTILLSRTISFMYDPTPIE